MPGAFTARTFTLPSRLKKNQVLQRHVSFSFSAPYYTLNNVTPATKYIWVVCHGYAQLAEFFVQKFDFLDSSKHFVIAPQGLSRLYLDQTYGRVGASWMTKEDRETELTNQRAYFDAVFDPIFEDIDFDHYKLILFGFSQGVSAVTRLAAHKKWPFHKMVLWAGGFPKELTPADFAFVSPRAEVIGCIGRQDIYYSEQLLAQEKVRLRELFGKNTRSLVFEGKHEVNREELMRLASKF